MNPFKNEQVWNKKKRQVELQDYSFFYGEKRRWKRREEGSRGRERWMRQDPGIDPFQGHGLPADTLLLP